MITSKNRTILKKFKALAFLISFLAFTSWSIHSNSQTSSQYVNDSPSTQDIEFQDPINIQEFFNTLKKWEEFEGRITTKMNDGSLTNLRNQLERNAIALSYLLNNDNDRDKSEIIDLTNRAYEAVLESLETKGHSVMVREWLKLNVSLMYPDLIDRLLYNSSYHIIIADEILTKKEIIEQPQWISWMEYLMKRGTDTVREAITENLLQRYDMMEELIRLRKPKELKKLIKHWLKSYNAKIIRDILRTIFPKKLIDLSSITGRSGLIGFPIYSISEQILRERLDITMPKKSMFIADLRRLAFEEKIDEFLILMEKLIVIGSSDVRILTNQGIQRDDMTLVKYLEQQKKSVRLMNSLTQDKNNYNIHLFLAKEILTDHRINRFSLLDHWVDKILMERLRFKGFYTVFENPMLDLLSKDFVILGHPVAWANWIEELIRIRGHDFQRALWEQVLLKETAMKHPKWEKLVRALDESLLKDESIQKLLLKHKTAQATVCKQVF